MKKALSVALLLVFALSGCSEQNNDKQSESNQMTGRQRVLDFERPEERANISGIVKTVVGNEVTILKIERPENAGERSGESGDSNDDDSEPKQRLGGGFGGGMGSRMTSGTADADARIAMLKKLSTGEERIIIPVGVRMLKKIDDEMAEATLEDIERDKMLMIWTNTDITDRNVASFVVIN